MNTPTPSLWICFALDREARPLRRISADMSPLRILVTGMGARRTTECIEQALERSQPEWVLTCGFAGGLTQDCHHGDVLFETDSPRLSNALTNAKARPGRFHCSPRIAITIDEKRELASRTQADAVEMESHIIRHICAQRGIASATVRAISDTANEDLPLDFNQLTGADEQLSFVKLTIAILKRPWVIPKLMKLGRHSSLAATRLTECLFLAAMRLKSPGH